MPDKAELAQFLQDKFPQHFLRITEFRGMQTIHIRGGKAVDLLRILKTDPRFAYNFLADLTAVDHLELGGEARFAVVYHLLNQHHAKRVVVKAWVDEDRPELPSAQGLWKTADWQEREVYDLFGITFTNHPNMTRIMNPENYQGYPLRRDYPLRGRGERDDFPVVRRAIGSKWTGTASFE